MAHQEAPGTDRSGPLKVVDELEEQRHLTGDANLVADEAMGGSVAGRSMATTRYPRSAPRVSKELAGSRGWSQYWALYPPPWSATMVARGCSSGVVSNPDSVFVPSS
jgi:hypothetical protein